MQSPRRKLVRDLLCIAVVVAVYLAVALPRYRIGIDWSDEGFLAYGAERVAQGQVPNRDFVSVQPPLSFYTVALAFKLLGTSLLTLRIFGVALHVCLGLLIYLISRQFVRPWIALAAALPSSALGMPVYGFAPFAIWQGVVAAFAAMLLYLRAATAGQKWHALAAGLLTAITLILRQDQAVYIALSILFATLALALAAPDDRVVLRSALVWWAVGAGAVMIVFVGWSLATGAFSAMWQQVVVFPLTTYGKTSSSPFPWWESGVPFARNMLTLVCYLPLFIAAATLVWVIRRTRSDRLDVTTATAAFLCGWSLLAYCEMLTRSDLQHFLPALPVFMIMAAFGFEHAWEKYRNLLNRVCLSILAMVAAAYFLFVGPAAVSDPRAADLETLDLPRGGTRMPRGKWITDFIKGVDGYVPANRPILALPYEPLFYFLCERPNPTHWNYLWRGDQTPGDHAELIAEARRNPPAVIFLTNENAMTTYAPTIVDYVHSGYKLAGKFGQLSVYFPNDAPAR